MGNYHQTHTLLVSDFFLTKPFDVYHWAIDALSLTQYMVQPYKKCNILVGNWVRVTGNSKSIYNGNALGHQCSKSFGFKVKNVLGYDMNMLHMFCMEVTQ